MRKHSLVPALIFCLFCLDTHAQNYWNFYSGDGITADCEDSDPYILIFHDEFNGTELDDQKWLTYYPNDLGSSNPGTCQFCRSHDVDPNDNRGENQVFLDENLNLLNGELVITGDSDPATAPNGVTYGNSAGVIHSKVVAGQTQDFGPRFLYGRFEMRVKLPSDNLWWPAFWLYGTDGDGNGGLCGTELDIFELFPDQPSSWYQTNVHGSEGKINDTIVCGAEYADTTPKIHKNFPWGYLQTGYHTFALEWTEYEIRYYIDGTLMHTVYRFERLVNTGPSVPYFAPVECGSYYPAGNFRENLTFAKRYTSIIANLATTHNTEPNSDEMKVDYIRVWQKNPDPKFTDCNIRKISGPSEICVNTNTTYTMLGSNTSLEWTTDTHLDIVSTQGNQVTVKTSSPFYRGPSTISVKAESEYCSYKDTSITIWVGTPNTPSTFPSGNPAINLGYGSVLYVYLTSAPGAHFSSAVWTGTGNVSLNLGSGTGSIGGFTGTGMGSGQFSVRTSNGCGLSPLKTGEVNVTSGGGGQIQFSPFRSSVIKVSPNPATKNLNIEFGVLSGLINSIILIDPISSNIIFKKNNVYGNNYMINISKFKNGVYFLKIEKQDGSTIIKNIMIEK